MKEEEGSFSPPHQSYISRLLLVTSLFPHKMTAKEGKKETKLDFSLFALLLFLLVGKFSIFVLSPDGKGKKSS